MKVYSKSRSGKRMNRRRVLIATAVGMVCGLFCASGIIMLAEKGELDFKPISGILASIVYNRVLVGFFIGIVDNITVIHPILNGAIIGAFITMSIISFVDGDIIDALSLTGFWSFLWNYCGCDCNEIFKIKGNKTCNTNI